MSEESNPLEELYEDRDEVDQKRLADALKGVIGIDIDSGEPIYHEGYQNLSNKKKFVAQMLYRRASVALNERDESQLGGSDEEFAAHLEVSGSAVRNYAADLPFVERDSDLGGYVIPGYAIERAISFIESD